VYDPAMNDACAFVLAGGQSSRMARDKAFLQFGGSTLLERALTVVREVATEVRIVGSAEKFAAFGETVEDQFRGCGPLGGIHAALRSSACEYNVMLAVDTPFVEGKFLAYLLDEARIANTLVTVPRAEDRWQPLCAVYRREFATLAEASLRAGRNRIDPLFSEFAPRIIEEREITEQGFTSEMFRNLNTPEEFEQAVLIKKK
jgi:molybdenum cofactor guanylyltransferase